MHLTSPHLRSKLHPTAEEIRRAFHQVAQAGLDNHPFLILDDVSDFCQGFVQAIRQSAGWWVEFKPSDSVRHYRLLDSLTENEAAAVFEDFLRRGRGVAGMYSWKDVTDDVAAEGWNATPESYEERGPFKRGQTGGTT